MHENLVQQGNQKIPTDHETCLIWEGHQVSTTTLFRLVLNGTASFLGVFIPKWVRFG